MKYIVRFFTAPLIVLGFLWQFIAGGFEAGRILASRWIRDLALKEIAKVVGRMPPTTPAPESKKGLH